MEDALTEVSTKTGLLGKSLEYKSSLTNFNIETVFKNVVLDEAQTAGINCSILKPEM
jgi:hypothetical protein